MNDFVVGNIYTLTAPVNSEALSSYSRVNWHIGDRVEIRRLTTYKALVRRGNQSTWIWKSCLATAPVDPSVVERKLGTMPEGDHIAISDPRIDWIWRDAAAFAQKAGYCSEYDRLTAALNIPGREQEFTLTKTINGLTGTFRVSGRSMDEALAKLDASLQSA